MLDREGRYPRRPSDNSQRDECTRTMAENLMKEYDKDLLPGAKSGILTEDEIKKAIKFAAQDRMTSEKLGVVERDLINFAVDNYDQHEWSRIVGYLIHKYQKKYQKKEEIR